MVLRGPAPPRLPPEQHEQLLQSCRSKFLEALQSIPNDEKKSYLNALERAPALLETETPIDRFIVCDSYNVEDAARRFVGFWEMRQKLFGDRALQPLRTEQNGALDENDVSMLLGGQAYVLPNDKQGRFVIVMESNFPPPVVADVGRCRLRALFYLLHVASTRPLAQQEGIVGLYVLNKPVLDDRSIAFGLEVLGDCLPVRLHCLHAICTQGPGHEDNFFERVLPCVTRVAGDFHGNGRRYTVQIGRSSAEVCRELVRVHGIAPLPTAIGGSFSKADASRWFDVQIAAENGDENRKKVALQTPFPDRNSTTTASLTRHERDSQNSIRYSRNKRIKQRATQEALDIQARHLSAENEVARTECARLESLLLEAEDILCALGDPVAGASQQARREQQMQLTAGAGGMASQAFAVNESPNWNGGSAPSVSHTRINGVAAPKHNVADGGMHTEGQVGNAAAYGAHPARAHERSAGTGENPNANGGVNHQQPLSVLEQDAIGALLNNLPSAVPQPFLGGANVVNINENTFADPAAAGRSDEAGSARNLNADPATELLIGRLRDAAAGINRDAAADVAFGVLREPTTGGSANPSRDNATELLISRLRESGAGTSRDAAEALVARLREGSAITAGLNRDSTTDLLISRLREASAGSSLGQSRDAANEELIRRLREGTAANNVSAQLLDASTAGHGRDSSTEKLIRRLREAIGTSHVHTGAAAAADTQALMSQATLGNVEPQHRDAPSFEGGGSRNHNADGAMELLIGRLRQESGALQASQLLAQQARSRYNAVADLLLQHLTEEANVASTAQQVYLEASRRSNAVANLIAQMSGGSANYPNNFPHRPVDTSTLFAQSHGLGQAFQQLAQSGLSGLSTYAGSGGHADQPVRPSADQAVRHEHTQQAHRASQHSGTDATRRMKHPPSNGNFHGPT